MQRKGQAGMQLVCNVPLPQTPLPMLSFRQLLAAQTCGLTDLFCSEPG